MIAASGLKLLPALKQNILGALLCTAVVAMTFVAVALLRVPLVWVLLVLGGTAGLWANQLLKRATHQRPEP
jgi:chromate transporter